MTEVLVSPAVPDSAGYRPASEQSGRRTRWEVFLDPTSSALIYAGILVAAVGFALIGIAWAKVAGLLNVALQLPYLVSAGFTGLGLVMVGLVVINIATKRRDAADRARQLERLASILAELQAELADGD